MKAEVLCYPGRSPKDNPRFLVTNLPHRPATVYTRLYCGRGDMENRLKELQQGLAMDRTSCSRFAANQLRLLSSLAAYVLFQVLQGFARGAAVGPAQVWTLRERLLKVAVWSRPETFDDRCWSASREPQRSMTSRGYDPRQSPGLGYKRVASCKDSFHGTDVLAVSERGAPERRPNIHAHFVGRQREDGLDTLPARAAEANRSTLIADITSRAAFATATEPTGFVGR